MALLPQHGEVRKSSAKRFGRSLQAAFAPCGLLPWERPVRTGIEDITTTLVRNRSRSVSWKMSSRLRRATPRREQKGTIRPPPTMPVWLETPRARSFALSFSMSPRSTSCERMVSCESWIDRNRSAHPRTERLFDCPTASRVPSLEAASSCGMTRTNGGRRLAQASSFLKRLRSSTLARSRVLRRAAGRFLPARLT
jgi:hypothetical protein